ncbi:MAG: HD domain-containing protein [Proteobacteria bacterium]|nr:HD domain-containing protein [Pseudomonadota bacterium]
MHDIKQLGLVSHIILSANHSRLEHCIGMSDMVGQMIHYSNVNYKKRTGGEAPIMGQFNLKEQVSITAGLLHDDGHASTGHPLERAIKKLFPENFKDHEQWGIEIVKRSEIYDIMNAYHPGFADEVLAVMSGGDNIWQQIHGDNMLNGDTADYLIRDRFNVFNAGFPIMNIIRNIEFGKNADGTYRLILGHDALLDYMRMLGLRGEMYKEVYFNGASIAAETFLPKLFTGIAENINSLDHGNPFIKFIASRGTCYESYLGMTDSAFNMMINYLSDIQIPGLSYLAEKYKNIAVNFYSEDFYVGHAPFAPNPEKIDAYREKTEKRGGILFDTTVNLYNSKYPEVYITCDEPIGRGDGLYATPLIRSYSDLMNVTDAKMRIIRSVFVK